MNKVILHGRLGKDPEVKYLASGKAVANFSVATDDGWGDNKQTNWHNVTAWEKTAEAVGKFLTKGSEVIVEGRIQYRSYDDKDGKKRYVTDIVATHVEFVGKKSDKPETDEPGF